jgi:hypothetical protein
MIGVTTPPAFTDTEDTMLSAFAAARPLERPIGQNPSVCAVDPA